MLSQAASIPLIGMPGLWEWIIIIAIILLLFGATKLPKLGKGLGEGIKNFKSGLGGDEKAEDETASKGKEDKEMSS